MRLKGRGLVAEVEGGGGAFVHGPATADCLAGPGTRVHWALWLSNAARCGVQEDPCGSAPEDC